MHRHAILACFVVSLTGCASHVEWLPDSKSFVYSHQNGDILRYDVETQLSQPITHIDQPDDKGWQIYSLRPDGQQIVFAESTAVGDETRVVTTDLKFLKLDGTQVSVQSLSWPAIEDSTPERKPIPTFVEWSPDGKYVLVGIDDAVAVHDVEADTFRVHESLEQILPGFLGASPWRPDGQGFLASSQREGQEDQPVFVTTDGRVQPIAADGLPEADSKNSWPVGSWDGPVLTIQMDSTAVHIDTAGLHITVTKREPVAARSWQLGESKLVLEEADGETRILWTRGSEQQEIDVPLGAALTLPQGPIVVSPDQRWAVVVGRRELVLVGESGVVDKITVAEVDEDVSEP